MTPCEELRAAAQHLRALAKAATPGQWSGIELANGWAIEAVDPHDVPVEGLSASDAAWIAAMSPAVAEPLAALLEESAHQVRFAYVMEGEHASEGSLSVIDKAVLAFARSLVTNPAEEASDVRDR